VKHGERARRVATIELHMQGKKSIVAAAMRKGHD